MPTDKNTKVLGYITMLSVGSGSFSLEVTHQDTKWNAMGGFGHDDSMKMAGALSQYQLCRDALRDNRKVLVEFIESAAHHPIVRVSVGERVSGMQYAGSRIVEISGSSVKAPINIADSGPSTRITTKKTPTKKTGGRKVSTRKTTARKTSKKRKRRS